MLKVLRKMTVKIEDIEHAFTYNVSDNAQGQCITFCTKLWWAKVYFTSY